MGMLNYKNASHVNSIMSSVRQVLPGREYFIHDTMSKFDAGHKCSGLVHWDDPEGWDREGGGKGIQDGEHM